MASPDRLYGIARQILDTVAAGLDGAGPSHAAPSRQYVSDGNLVAWDCEQLVVAIAATYSHEGNVATEYQGPAVAMAARAAEVEVWLVRCCPTPDDDGEPPTAAAIDASAAVVLADPMIILDTLWRKHAAGELATCKGLVFRRWQAVGPSGGLTGGVMRLVVNLTDV